MIAAPRNAPARRSSERRAIAATLPEPSKSIYGAPGRRKRNIYGYQNLWVFIENQIHMWNPYLKRGGAGINGSRKSYSAGEIQRVGGSPAPKTRILSLRSSS